MPNYWMGGNGGTTATAQLTDFTPANVEIGDIFTLTATAEDGSTTAAVSFTATVATVANVTAGLVAAWNLSTSALHTPVTATDMTTKLRLSADTAGVPFYVAATTTDGGGANTQTLTKAVFIASAGPNDFNTAANHSNGAVPVSTDDYVIDGRGYSGVTYPILYGLNQSGVTLASLNHYKSSPAVGTTSYALKISATTASLSQKSNDGTSPSGTLCNINFGTNAATVNIYDSSNTGAAGLPPTLIAGSHASNALNIYGGVVGVGLLTPGQSCNFPTVLAAGGTLTLGSGTSWTTCTNNGARLTVYKTATGSTFDSIGGTSIIFGSAKLGALVLDGGTVQYNVRVSGDDVTTLTLNGGKLDLTGAAQSITGTNITVKLGGQIELYSATQLDVSSTVWTFDFANTSNLTVAVKKAA
jgi:hypothetical protein